MTSDFETPRNWPVKLKHDFLPSIVVFLVALPLGMGIAIASNVPVAAGLVTGIVGGILVGMLSGAPLQVSGPAAGLTVIVYDIVTRHGLESLGLVVLGAGIIQFAAGLLRLGQWFRAVSPAVIKGMLAGIGILIFASQFHVMVDDSPKENGLRNLVTIPEAVAKGLPLPKIGSAEEREFRTAHLKQIGTLHNRQIEVQEAVGEVIPEQATPEQASAQVAGLAPLVERQKAVREALRQQIAELEAFGLMESRQTLAEAAAAALAATDRAIEDLEQGRVAEVRQSQEEAEAAIRGVLGGLKHHDWAAKVGLLTIILIVAWKALAPKRLEWIPAPLTAVVAATAVAAALSLPVLYIEVPERLVEDLHFPSLTVLWEGNWQALLMSAVVVAVVASTETLLCTAALDQMHQGPRANYDRELTAQGVGNMICGTLGALPMTGVIVRSSTNVLAGAKSRWSAVMHGTWLLLLVLLAAGMLRMIPVASLAAILVYTGYKLVDPKSIKELWAYGKGEVLVYAATVVTIVTTDLLKGVILGFVLAAVKLLLTVSKVRVTQDREPDGTITLRLHGAATFLQLPILARELDRVPREATVHVASHALGYIDHACLALLESWVRQHEATGGRVTVDWDALHARYRDAGAGLAHQPPHLAEATRAAG